LSLLAGIAVATLLSLHPMNDQLHRTQALIDISRRQSVLSQRIAISVLEQAIAGASDDTRVHRQLEADLQAFSSANEVLAVANDRPEPWRQQAARSRAFVSTVYRLESVPVKPIPDAQAVEAIAQGQLAPLLNGAMNAYAREADALALRIRWIERLPAVAAVLLILIEAVLILCAWRCQTRLVIEGLEGAIDVLHKRERALAKAARLSQLGEEMVGIGHWRLDVRTRRVTWSPQMFAIHGLPVSSDASDLEAAIAAYHPDDRDVFRSYATDAMTEGRGFDFELRLVRSDGEIRKVVAWGAAEFDPSGAVEAVFGVFMDVTDARRAEAAVRDSEARYRLLAENTSDMIVTATFKGRTQYVSPSATKLTGYNVDRMTGIRVLDFVHPEDRAAMIKAFRALAAGAPPERVRWRGRHKSGDWVWFESMPALARDPITGAAIGFIDVVRDVTRKHNIEEAAAQSEARYKILAENVVDIIMKIGCNGKVTYISPSVYTTAGYEPAQIMSQHAIKFVHPEDRRRVFANFVEIIEGKAEERPIEYRLLHKDGRTLWLEARPRAVRDPNSGRIVAVTDLVRDISERKALEASLRAAKLEAEAATVAKSEFLANMSHEVRTPLTSIQGFSRLLADQRELSPLSRHYMDRILTAGDGLMRIINDLLDFSKLEAGQMPLQLAPASIIEITKDVLDLLGPQADKENIIFSLEIGENIPKTLALDGLRVRQIFLNLVGNAIKFTRAGRINISLTYDTSLGRLTCAVADTGAGIAEDQLQRLFQRFSQIHGAITHPQGGTGLGLAICKGLVDMMGGVIGVESVAGKGSTFWFEIPAAQAALPSPMPTGVGGHLDGVRVLIVDDQEGTRELVNALLTPFGAEVSEAANGQEAVDISASAPFDVILMDLRMPVLDGVGAVAAIRSGQGPNSNIPILAFSADVGSKALGDLGALGFDGQLAKPVAPEQLVSTLTSLVFGEPSLALLSA